MSPLLRDLIDQLGDGESLARELDPPRPLGELTAELGTGDRTWAADATTPNVLWVVGGFRLVADLDSSDRVVRIWLGRSYQ